MKRTKSIRTLPSANYRMASIKLKKFKVSDLKMELVPQVGLILLLSMVLPPIPLKKSELVLQLVLSIVPTSNKGLKLVLLMVPTSNKGLKLVLLMVLSPVK